MIAPIVVDRVPLYRGLDDESGDVYYQAGQRKAFVTGEVINPFETGLKESTGYGDDNIPDSEVMVGRITGHYEFKLKVTPTTKRPSYKDVFDIVYAFLTGRQEQYEAGERPVGVFTIDGEPYISAFEVLHTIKEAKDDVTSKGVKIEIVEKPDIPGAETMVVPLGMDFSDLSEGNVSRYLEACSLSTLYGEYIKAFEDELLGLTGYSNGNPPEQTEHMYRQIGGHIFHVRSVPFESVSYGKVIAGLDKEPGKRKPENGGDLVLVTNDIEVPRIEVLKPKTRDGDRLVRLNALVERIDYMVDEHTERKVRQKPLNHYPIV